MVMFLFSALLLLSSTAAFKLTDRKYETEFTAWMAEFQQQFPASEMSKRFAIFKENLDYINEHNSKNASWTMGMNMFGALTLEERKRTKNLHMMDAENRPLMKQPEPVPKRVTYEVARRNSSCWSSTNGNRIYVGYWQSVSAYAKLVAANSQCGDYFEVDLTNDNWCGCGKAGSANSQCTESTGTSQSTVYRVTSGAAPDADSLDHRNHGRVNSVVNQGGCGSCAHHSTIAAIETWHAKKTGRLYKLSEQQALDCNSRGSCSGSWPQANFDALQARGGVCTRSSYPYLGRQEKCKSCSVVVPTAGSRRISESSMKSALTDGGVSVCMHWSGSIEWYKNGVYSDTSCKNTNRDTEHAVAVIGYGTDNGQKYWIIRNSWGSSWGENGYIRVLRDRNICAIGHYIDQPK